MDENELICMVPNDLEINEALFCMGSLKSRAQMDFHHFFISTTGVLFIKKSMKQSSFFTSGSLVQKLSHTYIALIPKVDGTTSINQFRPISLCTMVYKVISKILVQRLKFLLPKIIFPWQGAFVTGSVI